MRWPTPHYQLRGTNSATDAKKQEEAKRAFDLSGNLLREQKLLVEARYREAASEWDKAADIYRTLQTIAPDELDYGLKFGVDADSR